MNVNNRSLGMLLLIGAVIILIMGVVSYFYASDYAGYVLIFMGAVTLVAGVMMFTGRIHPKE